MPKTPKVCLDPGHGGKDGGASANGIIEKWPNIQVGLLVRDMLKAHGLEVVMTRIGDSDASLQERTDLANRENVDAFISIHHNAAGNPEARGLEIYHSVIGGEGKRLAELIHDRYMALIPELPTRGVKTKTLQDGRDYYYVIRETRMPAVIIEGGFLTNLQDAALIVNRDFQQRQAQAISQGVLLWYGRDVGTDTGTPILGKPQATVEQAKAWAKSRGATEQFVNLASIYWKYGTMYGIRPDVLYAQAAKETAFGRFGGAVVRNMHNFAGIKVANPKGDRREDHEAFPDDDVGVHAHFQHMCAYVGLEIIGPKTHARQDVVRKLPWAGTIRYVEELGGRWAPSPDYGVSIVRDYLKSLLATPIPKMDPEEDWKARALVAEEKLARIREIVA